MCVRVHWYIMNEQSGSGEHGTPCEALPGADAVADDDVGDVDEERGHHGVGAQVEIESKA